MVLVTDQHLPDPVEGNATLKRMREWPIFDLTIRYLRATDQLSNRWSWSFAIIGAVLGPLNYRLTWLTLPERVDEPGFEFFRYVQGGLSLIGMLAIALLLFYLWKRRRSARPGIDRP